MDVIYTKPKSTTTNLYRMETETNDTFTKMNKSIKESTIKHLEKLKLKANQPFKISQFFFYI